MDNPERNFSITPALTALLTISGLVTLLAQARVRTSLAYLALCVLTSMWLLLLATRRNGTPRAEHFHSNYLFFVIFLWFISPEIRRVDDYFNGWDERSFYTITPLACTLVSAIGWRLRGIGRQPAVFIALLIPAMVLPYVTGLFVAGTMPATFALANWLAPIVFAAYLATNSDAYPSFDSSLRKTCVIGTSLMSFYAAYQFVFPPPWDIFWIENAPITSVGLPLPGGFRAFGTMNSPMIFAPVLASLIIYIFSIRIRFKVIILFVATTALLLTSVRAAWGGLVIGVALFVILRLRKDPTSVWKPVAVGSLGVLAFLAITVYTPYGSKLQDRFDSIGRITEDTSFNERLDVYELGIRRAQSSLGGEGLGTIGTAQALSESSDAETAFDSGLLQIPISLGWISGSWYALLLALAIAQLARGVTKSADPAMPCYLAILVSTLVQMIFSNRLSGPAGFFFFLFLGLYACAKTYKQHNRPLNSVGTGHL